MELNAKLKRYLGIIKFPLTIIILLIVLLKIDFLKISDIISDLKLVTVIILLTISLIKIILQYLNWNLFLKLIQEVRIRPVEKITSFFVGLTFRMIAPGGIGVYGRMFYLSARKKDSFLSITYEKMIQAWCIIFFASIASALYFHSLPSILKIILPVITLMLPFLILIFSPGRKKYYIYFQKYRQTLIPALLIQITINTLTIIQYDLFFKNYLDFKFITALQSVPLVQFANLIPITISGLGIREYIAMNIYPALGVNQELAIACSLIVFSFSNIIPAIIGVFFVLFKHRFLTRK